MAGEYPRALEHLAERLASLPGVGQRTAERLALALLDWDEQTLRDLGAELAELRQRVHICKTCGNLADEDACRICRNPHRDPTLICVVETARQVPIFERSGRYEGVYHVLGDKVSPLRGVDLEDLAVDSLCKRIEANGANEVMLATSPDLEGEATAACVAEELRERFPGLRLTRLARGLPMGADLSYADAETMAMAIESRRDMS